MAATWRVLALCVPLVLAPVAMAAVAVSPVASRYHVQVQVFFRAFCPACQWFVGDPLLELIRQEDFRNIIDLHVYPAAGMIIKDGVFDCEGGDLECEGHQWEVCIIDKDRDDVVKYVGNLACIEGDESGEVGEWETKLQNCFTPEERAVLKECYDKRSNGLLREMMKVKGFDNVEWMPYTLVEGGVLGSASQGVGLHEMQTSICANYKGPKKFYPQACQQIVGPQKEFAPDEPEVTALPVAVAQVTPKAVEPAEAQKGAAVPVNNEQEAEEEELDLPIKGDGDAEGRASPDKVRLDVYWRAFCPGCKAFVSKPLLKLLRDAEFRKIVDFHPVPAAGTFVDSNGKFVCAQGRVECAGHRVLSCAVEEYPKVEELIEHLACLETGYVRGSKWSTVVAKCFDAEGQKKMNTCYDERSVDLVKKHIKEREKVEIQWVPYVLLDSVVIGDARHGIGYKQLEDEVCRAFKGSEELRPIACQPKRLRQEAREEAKETEAPIINPCPPKKDKKAGAPAAVEKDAPGAGFRRPTGNAAEEARELEGVAAATISNTETRGFSLSSLLFPLGCFAIIGVLARRFSGDHKKYA